jgi:hypothetical protein
VGDDFGVPDSAVAHRDSFARSTVRHQGKPDF